MLLKTLLAVGRRTSWKVKDEALWSCPLQGSSWRQEAHGEGREKEGIQKGVEQRWRSEKKAILAGAQNKSPRGFLPPVVYVTWSEAAYSMPQRPHLYKEGHVPAAISDPSHRRVSEMCSFALPP